MLKFIKIFLIFSILYHIIITIIGYGIFGGIYPQMWALVRDFVRFFSVLIFFLCNVKIILEYLKKWKRPRIIFGFLLIFSVIISYFKGKGFYDIFVGIKYCFIYILIFLTASGIGYIISKKNKLNRIIKYIKFFKNILIVTLIVGFIWQILKFIWPNWFLYIGYGPFDDFKFGVKPPIYYLTGYEGTTRWQGIFSGPNNYGYFLIAFLPLIILLFKEKFKSWKELFINNRKKLLNIGFIILWILAILLTLSRTAVIGGIVVIAILNFKWIKDNKKISIGILVILILGLFGLSVLKSTSTLGHIKEKFSSISYVIAKPNGYGLGTSGPAIHFNGTILPENYFIQLMLDVGTIGFLIWAWLIFEILRINKKIMLAVKKEENKSDLDLVLIFWKGLNIGFLGLLVMGMFLHVFEDSMVNYLFFISWGIVIGFLSIDIKKK